MEHPEEREETRLTLLSRDELEELVQTRTEALENVMNTMVDVLVKLGPDGRIELANEAVDSILGYRPEDLVGKPIDQLLVDPDRTDALHERTLPELLLREGEVTDVEITCATADGETVPMSLSASVMRTPDGDTAGIVCVAKDISERKAAEERAAFLHSLLRHDVGNRLQIAHGFLSPLEGSGSDGDDEADGDDGSGGDVDRALRAVEDAIDLLEKVRTLDRVDDEERSTVRLEEPLAAAVERNEGLARDRGFDVVGPDDAALSVRAGPLLTELFANLLENSLKHSGGSRIEISVAERDGEAVVAVADDGDGIPDEEKARIVDRGYGDGSGSGLGLYLAERIVETYGGTLSIEDAETGGTRVVVTLPLER